MLYIDQRGTGLSTPVDADVLTKRWTAEQQAGYLKHFRADNIGWYLCSWERGNWMRWTGRRNGMGMTG